MEPQEYKVVNNNSHEISGWKILSRFLHERAPNLGGMNDDVQSDLSTLAFNNGEQLENFHIRILRLQQEIILSGETAYPTRLLFHYTEALSNSDKPKVFTAPKMTYLITFLENNGKLDVYTGGNVHGLYCYLEMIGAPTTFTTSGQRSHHFGTSYSTNNDAENL